MALTTSDFVYIWRTCPTMIRVSVDTGGYISLRYAPHTAIPCPSGYREVTKNEHDVKPPPSGVSPGAGIGTDAIFKPGNYDASESLARTRAIIRVVKSTIETALKVETMKGYDFSGFD